MTDTIVGVLFFQFFSFQFHLLCKCAVSLHVSAFFSNPLVHIFAHDKVVLFR